MADAQATSCGYSILRESNFFDRLYYMYHRLGIQSNILVAARYSSPETLKLAPPAVIAALRVVVETHPELRLVGVRRPSPARGRHRLWVAALHSIDLDACVEFVSDNVGPQLLERAHNEWFCMDDEPQRPWWKVLVTPAQEVIFVYHHGVADGMAGYSFHRTFLRALNNLGKGGSSTTVASIDPSSLDFLPHATTLSDAKPSIIEIIIDEILFFFIRLIYGAKLMFGSLPPAKPYFTSITNIAPPDQRTVTSVASLRIPAKQMQDIISACRQNSTTFTPLLIVLLMITFAIEWFPEAKLGCSHYAADLRKFIRMPKQAGPDGAMFNATGGGHCLHWLSKFRRAQNLAGSEKPGLDKKTVWALAHDYKKGMNKSIMGSGVRRWKAGTLVGPDLEDFVSQALPSIGRLTSQAFLVSNLGAISVPSETEHQWQIEDAQFSVSSTNGNIGSHAPIFSVAGVKGGDTVVNVAFEEDFVSREMAEAVLESTMRKLRSLV